uniref:Complex 1 LYR protein domain-containing protein n=1 Tax=Trieres chinensis TaxID=1514140 RepID=A0A7S2A1J3_TRICV
MLGNRMPSTIITPGTAKAASRHFKSSTTRREVLSLYREILRTCRAFHWCDEKGIPWNKRLKDEARKEFETAREERDPLIIARMLVVGRDCVTQIQQKFNAADQAAWERIRRDSFPRS